MTVTYYFYYHFPQPFWFLSRPQFSCSMFWWLLIVHRDIEVRTPFEVKREADDVHFTYLDTSGRPVVVLRKFNLVEQHIQDFEVSLCLLGGLEY